MTRTELKPCPFCGGEAWVIQILEDLYAVECRKCWTRTGTYQPTKAEAIEAWNRRAERTAKVVHKQQTHIVPPKSTTVAYETETNLWDECGNCGAMGMYHGWNYCPKCGAKLDWSE